MTVLCALLSACSVAPVARSPSQKNLGRVHYTPPVRSDLDIIKLFRDGPTGADAAGACPGPASMDPEGGEAAPRMLYRVVGRQRGERSQVVEACVGEELAGRVVSQPSGGSSVASASGKTGVSRVARSLPPEFGIWLATTDLFRQASTESRAAVDARGYGTILNVQRSSLQTRDRTSEGSYRGHVARSVLEFRLSAGVLCAAQLKIYRAEEERATPAREASRALATGKESDATLRERYGLVPTEKGQLLWQLVQIQQGGQSRYELKIHRSGDFDQPGSAGRVMDQVLVCRGARPLLAKEVPGLSYSVVRAGDRWRTVVRVGER